MFGTTIWEVRENATLYDVQRIQMWSSAKTKGEKINYQKEKAKNTARNNSKNAVRRPVRSRRRR